MMDQLLAATTFVVFMGGNSGQTVIELMRCHERFSKFDHVPMDDLGRYDRLLWMPSIETQYIKRSPNSHLINNAIGAFCWVKNPETVTWLRKQTLDWFLEQWDLYAQLDLREVLDRGQIIAIPTHLDPGFIDMVMPESRKIFLVDDDTYFAIRADEAKNPAKHPDDRDMRIRYLAQRVALHRAWNQVQDFDKQNSIVINRSRLFNVDYRSHAESMRQIFLLHGIDTDDALLSRTHQMVLDYIDVQRSLGYLL